MPPQGARYVPADGRLLSDNKPHTEEYTYGKDYSQVRLAGPTNEELISCAASVLNPRLVGDRLFGDVGCALTTRDGNLFCIETASGTGFCAEHSAIAANGHSR